MHPSLMRHQRGAMARQTGTRQKGEKTRYHQHVTRCNETFDRQNIISRKWYVLHPLYAILFIVPPSSLKSPNFFLSVICRKRDNEISFSWGGAILSYFRALQVHWGVCLTQHDWIQFGDAYHHIKIDFYPSQCAPCDQAPIVQQVECYQGPSKSLQALELLSWYEIRFLVWTPCLQPLGLVLFAEQPPSHHWDSHPPVFREQLSQILLVKRAIPLHAKPKPQIYIKENKVRRTVVCTPRIPHTFHAICCVAANIPFLLQAGCKIHGRLTFRSLSTSIWHWSIRVDCVEGIARKKTLKLHCWTNFAGTLFLLKGILGQRDQIPYINQCRCWLETEQAYSAVGPLWLQAAHVSSSTGLRMYSIVERWIGRAQMTSLLPGLLLTDKI